MLLSVCTRFSFLYSTLSTLDVNESTHTLPQVHIRHLPPVFLRVTVFISPGAWERPRALWLSQTTNIELTIAIPNLGDDTGP